MVLKSIELNGFKSFAKKGTILFDAPVTGIVGPNGSGKSNVVEAIRFVLGEQSIKSLRGKGGSDLIFKGSKTLSPQNRASVTIVFDNQNKLFSFADSQDTKTKLIGYDQVRIQREVFSDGSNKYSINDTEVRLKDIVELLASVNVGSSGHHIISQGEADRLLSSNPKERRIMIEDALGLKIYQYRIKETEKRLEKTEVNMKEVGALKRELSPHLSYLKKQVEKIEKAEGLRNDLITLYEQYTKSEYRYLHTQHELVKNKKSELLFMYETVSQELSTLETTKNKPFSSLFEQDYLKVLATLSEYARLKNELERSIGRLEGAKESLEQPIETEKQKPENRLLPAQFVFETLQRVHADLSEVMASFDVSFIHEKARSLQEHMRHEMASFENVKPVIIDNSKQIEKLSNEIKTLEAELYQLETNLSLLQQEKHLLEQKMGDERNKEADKQKGYYEVLSKRDSLESQLKLIEQESLVLEERKSHFENEIREGIALLGADMPHGYENEDTSILQKDQRDEIKKNIERIKIKLEESGGLGGSDTIKEYESTMERDAFLTGELSDLSNSISELRTIIADLKNKLDNDFKNGVDKINESFDTFFNIMFGGGGASLSISVEHRKKRKEVDEDEVDIPDFSAKDENEMEFERGIEIHVSLPHKKVKELSMLSGGERSLTSIALLFAMSQVNPPPFLVLDETDAALDEANSRRYGDMIENLSRVSQLVVVTHNRETMSRAGILYGVTVGSDGSSKLLSIKFDDATAYAK